MDKYVILSFDDGRKDTYTNAVPIMIENHIRATINITTDFVENPNTCGLFPAAIERSMTIANVLQLEAEGFEIANHSSHHRNTVDDIEEANNKLKEWGINIDNIGFASPYSQITENNSEEILKLVKGNKISYIRSGIQVRRESIYYKIIYLLEEIFKTPYLFYKLNKKNIFNISDKVNIFKGITINKNTTFREIEYLIRKMKTNSCVILNFHSVLDKQSLAYNDKWSWDIDKFEKLCQYLSSNKDIKVIRMIDLFKG